MKLEKHLIWWGSLGIIPPKTYGSSRSFGIMPYMIKTILKLCTAFILSNLLLGCGESSTTDFPQATITISSSTPAAINSDSTFQDLQGNPVEIADYQGKKILLNYWATWCAPCIREIPALIRAAEILKDENFIFLLASDESIEDINEFILDHNFDANFIKLNGFFASYGIQAMPSTVLYDSNGEIINSWLGEYKWDSAEVLAQLREAQ